MNKNLIKHPQVSFNKFAKQAFKGVLKEQWELDKIKEFYLGKDFEDYINDNERLYPAYKQRMRNPLKYQYKKFKTQISEFHKQQIAQELESKKKPKKIKVKREYKKKSKRKSHD